MTFNKGHRGDITCKLREGKLLQWNSPANMGWMYPKNSMLKRLFNKAILETTEEGVERKIYNKYFPNEDPSLCQQGFRPIGYEIVQSLFFILILGIGSSVVIFVIEKIISLLKILGQRSRNRK